MIGFIVFVALFLLPWWPIVSWRYYRAWTLRTDDGPTCSFRRGWMTNKTFDRAAVAVIVDGSLKLANEHFVMVFGYDGKPIFTVGMRGGTHRRVVLVGALSAALGNASTEQWRLSRRDLRRLMKGGLNSTDAGPSSLSVCVIGCLALLGWFVYGVIAEGIAGTRHDDLTVPISTAADAVTFAALWRVYRRRDRRIRTDGREIRLMRRQGITPRDAT